MALFVDDLGKVRTVSGSELTFQSNGPARLMVRIDSYDEDIEINFILSDSEVDLIAAELFENRADRRKSRGDGEDASVVCGSDGDWGILTPDGRWVIVNGDRAYTVAGINDPEILRFKTFKEAQSYIDGARWFGYFPFPLPALAKLNTSTKPFGDKPSEIEPEGEFEWIALSLCTGSVIDRAGGVYGEVNYARKYESEDLCEDAISRYRKKYPESVHNLVPVRIPKVATDEA